MDVDTSSDASSSQPTSPSTRITRSYSNPNRNLDPDHDKIASLTQKLYESLKPYKSSKKTNVTIPLSEFENLLSRSQQVALLTAASATATHRSREEFLSRQISDMSDKISSRLSNIESQLGRPSHTMSSASSVPSAQLSTKPILDGVRHNSMYLADGNLVIAAPISDGGSGTMLFRIHQSMLSLQSPVFASMFTLPRPDANRDVYDGVPFVRMPDDSKHIESLLKVLYNPSELPYKRLDPLTPLNVRRTLAMATKYEMEPLRERIVAQLTADWPTSLTEWDRLETEIIGLTEEHSSSAESYMVDGLHVDDRLPEPGAAIRLAMDWNIPKILPSAFYHLSRLTTDADWLECRKDRGSMFLERTARWDLLEAADLRLLLKLRENITACESLVTAPSKSCHSPDDCEDWWDTTCRRWDNAKDPLELMKKFVELRPSRGLCKPCWNATKDLVQERRCELWDEICECVEENTK